MAYLQVCTRTCSSSEIPFTLKFFSDSAASKKKKKISNLIILHEKKSLESYKVQCRTKTELKTTSQISKSPLRMSSLVVVHYIVKSNFYLYGTLSVAQALRPITIGRKFGNSDISEITNAENRSRIVYEIRILSVIIFKIRKNISDCRSLPTPNV